MQIDTQVNDPSLEIKLRQLLNELNLRANPNVPYLKLQTSEELNETKLNIINSEDETIDFLKIPLNKDSFRKRLKLWATSNTEAEFIRRNALLKLNSTIGAAQTQKIFDSFLASSQIQFTLIKNALEDNDYKVLYDSAHYLKTSAGIIGADMLFNFCEVAIEKTKNKETWTKHFLVKFTEIEMLFQKCANNFRP